MGFTSLLKINHLWLRLIGHLNPAFIAFCSCSTTRYKVSLLKCPCLYLIQPFSILTAITELTGPKRSFSPWDSWGSKASRRQGAGGPLCRREGYFWLETDGKSNYKASRTLACASVSFQIKRYWRKAAPSSSASRRKWRPSGVDFLFPLHTWQTGLHPLPPTSLFSRKCLGWWTFKGSRSPSQGESPKSLMCPSSAISFQHLYSLEPVFPFELSPYPTNLLLSLYPATSNLTIPPLPNLPHFLHLHIHWEKPTLSSLLSIHWINMISPGTPLLFLERCLCKDWQIQLPSYKAAPRWPSWSTDLTGLLTSSDQGFSFQTIYTTHFC